MLSKIHTELRRTRVALVLTVLVLGGCMRSPQAKSARYMDAGKKLLQKHDPARAILQFRNAAKALPQNPEAYYEIGEAFMALRDPAAAVQAYRKALEQDPKHAGARLRMAQIMVSSSDPQVVKNAMSDLQEIAKDTTGTPEVLNTLAFAQLRLGNVDGAIDSLDRVLTQSPAELGASAMMAQAKLLNHDAKGAEEVLLAACRQASRSAEARRVLGDFYLDQKKPAEAEAQFQAALAIDPKHGPALLDLARLLASQKRYQEADQDFQRLSKLEGYRSVHAIFLFENGRQEDAIRELEALVKENPRDRAIRSNLVVADRATGHAAAADQVLAQALKTNPKDADALLQQGEIAIERKNLALAEADLNQVLNLRPSEPEVHYLLAKLNEARGATLTYRQELSEVLRLNPNLLAVRLELARSLSATAAGARAALDLLDEAPAFQKDSLAILVQRNWALWTMGDLGGMRKGIDQGLARARTSDLLIQFGMWKLRSGDAVGARALLQEAQKLDPTDLRAVKALTQTYLAEKKPAIAIQKAQEFARQQPQSAAAQDFLGVLLLTSGYRTEARAAFVAAKNADSTYTASDLALVQVDAAENKFADAEKRLTSVLQSDGNNLTARLWLGNVEEILGHHNAAIEHFRKVVQADPDNAQASNNLAYLLTEYANQPDEALKYAQKAVTVAPDKATYCDTLGWALYRKGLYAPAIPYLERATAVKNPNVIWQYHLAMAYAKSGNAGRGRATLAAALRVNSQLPEAKLAQEVVEGGDHPQHR